MINDHLKRILALDCGVSTTTAILIETAEGRYKLVGHATVSSSHQPPWQDVTLAVIDAIAEIESATDRQLLTPARLPLIRQDEDSPGIDIITAVTSAAEPVRVVLAGIISQLSRESGQRAINTTYALANYQIGLEDGSDDQQVAARISILQNKEADVVLLVGGIDGGVQAPILQVAQSIALALHTIEPQSRPEVIFAGNNNLRQELAQILGGLSRFKSVDNVRPSIDVERLDAVQEELTRLYAERQIAQLPGMDTLSPWLPSLVLPAARSYAQTIRYIGQNYRVNVLGVDIGSQSTTITARHNAFEMSQTWADVGMGRSMPHLLQRTELEAITRWLPFEVSDADCRNFILNKGLFPDTVPQSEQDFWLELAVARENLRWALDQIKQVPGLEAGPQQDANPDQEPWLNFDWIIGSGQVLSQINDPVQATHVLLDALEPVGMSRLFIDKHNIVGMLGGIATVQPVAAAQMVEQALQTAENGLFLNLGMVIAPLGYGKVGGQALRCQMTTTSGREVDLSVPFGDIRVIPLAANEEAHLKIRPSRHFTINPQWGEPGERVEATIRGGVLGLIIDARGRPIDLPIDAETRCQQIKDWAAQLASVEESVLEQLEEVAYAL